MNSIWNKSCWWCRGRGEWKKSGLTGTGNIMVLLCSAAIPSNVWVDVGSMFQCSNVLVGELVHPLICLWNQMTLYDYGDNYDGYAIQLGHCDWVGLGPVGIGVVELSGFQLSPVNNFRLDLILKIAFWETRSHQPTQSNFTIVPFSSSPSCRKQRNQTSAAKNKENKAIKPQWQRTKKTKEG